MNDSKAANDKAERRRLLTALQRHLSQTTPGEAIAQEACLSRFHFQRVFRQSIGEAPGGLRRRLVLEKAAYALRNTHENVTDIAFDAGYQSLEGFSRAFKAAFGQTPRAYRQASRVIKRLPGTSGVHYDAARHVPTERKPNMDLTDRILESDYFHKRRLLECAQTLTDTQLDAPLAFRHNLMPFVEPERTLREALVRMSGGENGGWIAAMLDAAQWPIRDDRYKTVKGDRVSDMVTRLESFQTNVRAFVAHVKANNLWDTEWVDDTCEQPETFAYGDVLEASLTWGIAQRMVVQRLLEQMGLHPI